MRYPEIDTGLKRRVGLRRYTPKWSKIMTRLLNGKHFWIALVLATRCLIASLRTRRTASLRPAPNLAAPLRTVEDTEDTRPRYIHKITRHTFGAVTPFRVTQSVSKTKTKEVGCVLHTSLSDLFLFMCQSASPDRPDCSFSWVCWPPMTVPPARFPRLVWVRAPDSS